MRATWSLNGNLSVIGATDRKTPRLWTIQAKAVAEDGAVEKLTVRTRQKCFASDLIDVLNDNLAAFEMEHGRIVDCSFVATAR